MILYIDKKIYMQKRIRPLDLRSSDSFRVIVGFFAGNGFKSPYKMSRVTVTDSLGNFIDFHIKSYVFNASRIF